MVDEMRKAIIISIIIEFLWDSLVLGVTSYVVFWKGLSGWWFVLAIIFCTNSRTKDLIEKDKKELK